MDGDNNERQLHVWLSLSRRFLLERSRCLPGQTQFCVFGWFVKLFSVTQFLASTDKPSIFIGPVPNGSDTNLVLRGDLHVSVVAPDSVSQESIYYRHRHLETKSFEFVVLQVTSTSSTANFNVFSNAVLGVTPDSSSSYVHARTLKKTTCD